MFICQKHTKAQPTVVLVSYIPERGPQLKVSSDGQVELGVKLRTRDECLIHFTSQISNSNDDKLKTDAIYRLEVE